jgi:hypothetical protein
MGTLATLGYDLSERKHAWFHMENSSHKGENQFLSHKRHLQMTYELMGTGLVDPNSNNLKPVAEFLILQNNKSLNGWTSSIEVYSTAELINQYIEGEYTGMALRESLLHPKET